MNMVQSQELYDLLGSILAYPDEDYHEKVRHCVNLLREEHPGSVEEISPFASEVEKMGVTDLEELYTRTFDINPVSALEIGWHLYGEQYERGAFLVKMRELSRTLGVEESTELPDHLTHVLPLVGRMEQEDADMFVEKYLLPGLKKMIAGFSGKNNVYENVLKTIRDVLADRHIKEKGEE
jgi:nitrate reductase molybdenum cofactor assembly chaperone